jgi:hypothetical protein
LKARSAVALVALALLAAEVEGAFGFRKVLTVQPGQVSVGPHANFPLLVSLVDPNLATVLNGGNVTSSSGYDIIFRGEDVATCAGPASCRLEHEIERYDPTTGTLVAWVRVPSINDGTPVYLYYGDATITRPTEAPSAVWEPDSPATPGYVGVWHLKETGAGNALEFRDSSKNSNHGQGGEGDSLFLPAPIAGKIGFAQDFSAGAANPRDSPPPDGKWDVIDAGHSARLLGGDQITLQAWIQHNIVPALNDYYGFLSYKGNAAGYRLLLPQNSLRVNFQLPPSGLTTTNNVTTGAWHHVVATYDGATMRVYIDGVQDPTTAARAGPILPATGGDAELFIGHGDQQKDRAWSYPWVGQMDEVRISRVARTADWILTEYRNHNAPLSFYSVGPETPGSYATPLFTLLTVNYRSIGTNGGVLHGAGDASVALGSTTVSFGGAASLPANVGTGDTLTFTGAPAEVLYILSRDSATQVTLQAPATLAHTNQTYTITRSFTLLGGWETARQGNLVTENRREVGIAYNDGPFTAGVNIAGWTTDSVRYPMLIPAAGHRHNGTAGTGVVIDGMDTDQGIRASTSFTVVDGFELRRNRGGAGATSVVVQNAAYDVVLRNLLIYDFFDAANSVAGIRGQNDSDYMVQNSIIYDGDVAGIRNNDATANGIVENVTVYDMAEWGVLGTAGRLIVRNTISMGNPSGDFSGTMTQGYNLSSDLSATDSGAQTGLAAVDQFVSITPGSENLHLKLGSNAIDKAYTAYMPQYWTDIDGASRLFTPVPIAGTDGPWDIGADEFGATTAVELVALAAQGLDSAVELTWQTGSELDNLGFHLSRSTNAAGPWQRITASLIPGLGSSPEGKRYAYTDAGLLNGTRYFYRLEDVDASSKTTAHGPVSAVPEASAPAGDGSGGNGGAAAKPQRSASGCPDWVLVAYGSMAGADGAALRCTRHGNPEAVSLGVLSHDARQATLELRTGGFYALHEPAGTVRVFVPGFDYPQDEESAALPIRRALADAVVGRKVQLGGVRALELVAFKDLVPSALGRAEMHVGRDGTVRAVRRGRRVGARPFPRSELVRLLPSLFQGEKKSARVEIAPLRFDAQRQQLVLAKRVRVRLLFTGRETGESGRGSLGRAPRARKPAVAGGVLARLYTTSRGLHVVSFDQLFPGQRRGLGAAELRLERQGEPIGFHIEPATSVFGPGSRLFFFADTTAGSTEFTSEVAYELVSSRDGVRMPRHSAAPGAGGVRAPSLVTRSFETNRLYQPGLLEAEDVWLWEALASGATRAKSFSLSGVEASGTAELDVFLQGASESGKPVDHHVSVSLNGVAVGEARFAGKLPHRVSLSLQASLLREGPNELSLTNVADTGVSSFVFLDRFSLAHPQLPSLTSGLFEGTWGEGGTATVSGLTGPVALLDVTPAAAAASATGASVAARWLTGFEASGGWLRFGTEPDRLYLAVSQDALLAPRVAAPESSTLRASTNRADYVLIAPRAFLAAAEPLVERRRDQGLTTRAVSLEEIAAEFGRGRASAEAIKSFLAHAFHSWGRPSPRYVLLLGDASYDPRNFTGTSQPSPLPALWAKTSYLWTASDPELAAVNGEDSLPDLAIGRLPATTLEQAEALVGKLLDWEDSGQGLRGSATLVADNPDLAGDFEADVEDIRASFLASRETRVLKLGELGSQTRASILDALNTGLSYLSYVGHGGAAVWASENVWNSWDAPSLQAQSLQPLLVTMNCLNGYFVAPGYESLAESLLKAKGRGAIASFSPSGLSLDGPAHQYHRALMAELTSGRHERLGDAILAAQETYARTGLMPELVGVYHLLGDPSTRIR